MIYISLWSTNWKLRLCVVHYLPRFLPIIVTCRLSISSTGSLSPHETNKKILEYSEFNMITPAAQKRDYKFLLYRARPFAFHNRLELQQLFYLYNITVLLSVLMLRAGAFLLCACACALKFDHEHDLSLE